MRNPANGLRRRAEGPLISPFAVLHPRSETECDPTDYRYLERVQDVRRETDPAGFPYIAEDLALPLQLFELRQRYAGDREVNAQLDPIPFK
jgi:hypothetical protein